MSERTGPTPPPATGTRQRDGCAEESSGPAANAGPLRDVLFPTLQVGWLVTSSRLLVTADGGRHWRIRYRARPGDRLSAIDFADARHGWLVGTAALLHTADGGRRWRAMPQTCPPVRTVDFITDRIGYAIASRQAAFHGAVNRGTLLRTTDGGRHWKHVSTPGPAQSVCLADPRHGWLGADGNIYRLADSGRSARPALRLQARHPAVEGTRRYPPNAAVTCAARDAGWALITIDGGAISQSPHIGYRLTAHAAIPLFAEQYFPHPAIHVRRDAPGSYPGPFTAVGRHAAVFIDTCPACGNRLRSSRGTRMLSPTAPLDTATNDGRRLNRLAGVGYLSAATAASFPTLRVGWVIGIRSVDVNNGTTTHTRIRALVVHTNDGGRSWQIQYQLPG